MASDLVPYEERSLTWEEQFQHILAEVAAGRSVHSILRDDEGMPPPRMFWMRLYRSEELFEKISRAREFGVEALLEQAMDIAMTPMEGTEITVEQSNEGAKRRVSRKDMLGHRRLAVETIIKRAQMIQPRKYGPKVDVTSDGQQITSITDAIAAGNRRLAERRKKRESADD